jgi:hypothetical protein
MKLRGPYLTMIVGLAVAAAIGAMSVNATDAAIEKAANTQATGGNANAPSQAPATTPPAEPTKAAEPTEDATPNRKAVYAGRVDGGGATIAISVKGAKAIAYVCDGKRVEAWLSGKVAGDQVTLTGQGNATLAGKITGNRLAGTVTVKKKSWDFDVKTVRKPSGLYQAAANVAGARVVGSWILLEDGTQVGVVAVDGEPGPAPAFDVDAGSVGVDGGSLIVMPVGPDGN